MKKLACFGLIVVAAGVASCTPSSPEKENATDSGSSTPAPVSGPIATAGVSPIPGDAARHWMQDAQLRGLMKDLSAKTQRDWPRDLPVDPEDEQTRASRNVMGAATLADALAAAAARIPDSITTVKMSEADRAGFQAEADTLREQALRLGQAARSNKVEQMQESLDAISATCISCHSRYRDFSGSLNLRQASANQPRDAVR